MRAAIEAHDQGADVALLSKIHPVRSHSGAAEGGINAALGNASDDDPEKHAYDTVKGSDYLGDQDAIEILCNEAPDDVYQLEHWGAVFSRTEDGRIAQRPFGAAGEPRTAYAADITGHVLIHVLYEQVMKRDIFAYEELFAWKLVVDDDRCQGVIAWDLLNGGLKTIGAKTVILATGGAGRLYKGSTNAYACTGDGMALALRVGVPLKDMEMMQFHPTTLSPTGILITEGCRGEGAYLINSEGERFLKDYTETIINLETVNPIEFFGVNNGKLDILKKKFPLLKILSRGTQLKLSGAPEQVTSAREKIELIVQYLERNGHMSENYFEQVLGGDDAETVDNFIDRNPNDVLVFGPNGKTVRARTANQKRLVQMAEKNDIVFAIGPAGTGKTYTAVALAVRALKNKAVKKIILTRPAVEAGENLGFLPGDLKEKIDPYLRPLYDALDDMIPADKLGYYMSTRTIEIAPLAYMRGRTLDNAFIILDEAQNSTDLQLKMFLTRIGANAKAIITGDITQVDLPRNQRSGLQKASRILKNIDGIAHIELDEDDVVRHRLVKSILRAYDKERKEEENRGEIK